jgi:hypothetical protein
VVSPLIALVIIKTYMGSRRALLLTAIIFSAALPSGRLRAQEPGQVLEFESGGLKYKSLTHNGVTIMFAPLPARVLGYAILQVAISNGSPVSWSIRPEDFRFEREHGEQVNALPAGTVIKNLLKRAGRGDVSKMIVAYEAALTGNAVVHSTNGYESRRQDALAVGTGKLNAAAAASAIAFVTTKLEPGQSTDGAVFYDSSGKPLGAGKLMVEMAGEKFEFPVEP